MRLNVFFEGLKLQYVLIIFLFSVKHSYLLTANIVPGVNNFLYFLKAVQELENSLRVRRNF